MTTDVHPSTSRARSSATFDRDRPVRDAVTGSPSQLNQTLRLMRSELFRLRKRPLTWIMLALVVIAAMSFYTVAAVTVLVQERDSGAREAVALDRVLEYGFHLEALVVFLVMVIFAANSIGTEFGWGTMRPLVMQSGSRMQMLASKVLSLLILNAGFSVVAVISVVTCAALASSAVGDLGPLPASSAWTWLAACLRLMCSTLPYVGVALMMAVLTRSLAVAIGVGVGIAMLEPAIWMALELATDAFDTVSKYGFDYPTRRLVVYEYPPDNPLAWSEALQQGGLVLAWTALMLAVTAIVFNRRDLTA